MAPERLRLLKVLVQPVFVVEAEDGTLSELVTAPLPVAPKDWPEFPVKGFAEATAALREEIEAGRDLPKPELERPPRAARRATPKSRPRASRPQ